MNKTVLITGASTGIGYEFANIFAKNNFDLVLVARSEDKLINLKKDLEEKCKISVKVLVKDLSQINSSKEIYDEIKKENIDVNFLINNAGFGDFGKFAEIDFDREFQMMNLNMITLVSLSKLFLKDMLQKNEGKIMNIGSTASFQSGPRMAVYFATKAFVLSFSEALSEELRATNISVTCLCPGPTESNFQKNASLENAKFFSSGLPSSKNLAEYGYKVMMKNKVVAIHGFRNRFMIFLERFVPRSFVRRVIGEMMARRV